MGIIYGQTALMIIWDQLIFYQFICKLTILIPLSIQQIMQGPVRGQVMQVNYHKKR